jgi:hypothetical protein
MREITERLAGILPVAMQRAKLQGCVQTMLTSEGIQPLR